MSEEIRNIARAFLYGFTGIGLFRRLGPIGVPMEFVDTRPAEEALASGDYHVASMKDNPSVWLNEIVRATSRKIERKENERQVQDTARKPAAR